MKENIKKILKLEPKDERIETGVSPVLSLDEIINCYLKYPGQVLTLIRIYQNQKIEAISDRSGLDSSIIEEYEKGRKNPPFQQIPRLAKAYGVDIKRLLQIYNYLKKDETPSYEQLGIAAQYNGPELSEDEKIDLKLLVQQIIEKRSQVF
jgi:transcriptional regulator with XRE-family HTH domain